MTIQKPDETNLNEFVDKITLAQGNVKPIVEEISLPNLDDKFVKKTIKHMELKKLKRE